MIKKIFAGAMAALLLLACSPLMAPYDQYSYAQATSVKVDALNVVAAGTEDYSFHVKDVANLQTEVQKLYEYDKNLPKNGRITEQWNITMDSSGHSLMGFLSQWSRKGKFDSAFVNDKKDQISKQLDQIIQLEAAKIKSK
ncbi:MAG TPA: hypothetical protein VGM31_06770 [Puia sp.]